MLLYICVTYNWGSPCLQHIKPTKNKNKIIIFSAHMLTYSSSFNSCTSGTILTKDLNFSPAQEYHFSAKTSDFVTLPTAANFVWASAVLGFRKMYRRSENQANSCDLLYFLFTIHPAKSHGTRYAPQIRNANAEPQFALIFRRTAKRVE